MNALINRPSYVEQLIQNRDVDLIFDELQVVEHWEKAIKSFRMDFDVDIYIRSKYAAKDSDVFVFQYRWDHIPKQYRKCIS